MRRNATAEHHPTPFAIATVVPATSHPHCHGRPSLPLGRNSKASAVAIAVAKRSPLPSQGQSPSPSPRESPLPSQEQSPTQSAPPSSGDWHWQASG
ncbi:unnamed protein product [Urochloa humidicola]